MDMRIVILEFYYMNIDSILNLYNFISIFT